MTIAPFRFADACEVLGPYLAQARKRDAARQAEAQREADRASGVAWAGLAGGVTNSRRTERQLREEAQAALDSAEAFAASPRGRFLAALLALEQSGHAGAAERARTAFARGFADPQQAACPAEIGTALSVLARLDAPQARDACLALAELLTAALSLAAE